MLFSFCEVDVYESKYCDRAELKLHDGDMGGFRGYASTFGNVDRAKEAVKAGAFKDTLDAFKRDGFIAVGHEWGSLPVATVKDAGEDGTGLWLEAEFHSTTAAQDARRTTMERIARGKSVGLSIGYSVLEDSKGEGFRSLDKIDLHEVSLVTVPCNPMAQVSGAKSNSLAGLPMAEHSARALAVIEEFVARVKDLSDLRATEDRQLSDAHRQRLMTLRDAAVELLNLSAPKADMTATIAAFAESQRTLARLNGVRR